MTTDERLASLEARLEKVEAVAEKAQDLAARFAAAGPGKKLCAMLGVKL